jgi:hypothetical protein
MPEYFVLTLAPLASSSLTSDKLPSSMAKSISLPDFGKKVLEQDVNRENKTIYRIKIK